jgi:hypothetical protein
MAQHQLLAPKTICLGQHFVNDTGSWQWYKLVIEAFGFFVVLV